MMMLLNINKCALLVKDLFVVFVVVVLIGSSFGILNREECNLVIKNGSVFLKIIKCF